MEVEAEEENEDTLTLTEIFKQSPINPRGRLINVATKKGMKVDDLEE